MLHEIVDVLGIGNAIIDVTAKVEDSFLLEHGMSKGGMMLIDEKRARAIYDAMGPGVETSGGSAANTVAGVASLRGEAAFIGKIRQDLLGEVFAHDLRSMGVRFATEAACDGPGTASCLVLVTPDAERTMNTFLGTCVKLSPDDVEEGLVRASRITYLEGYLFDEPLAKQAFRKAAAVARDAGRRIALSLSDTACVERHRDELVGFIESDIDILLCNQDELQALFRTELVEAVACAADAVDIAAVTRGANGSLVAHGTQRIEVPASSVEHVVDTTGAGDLFAAGFLYCLSKCMPLELCAQVGGLAAAEVIGHLGARPQSSLFEIVRQSA